jgi:hypothetical protein
MLDVHPPEHAAHTFRDFLIHIATIVIGLLIAIGLEQTVELLHHRTQIRETREALTREHDANLRAYTASLAEFERQTAALSNNLLVLHYIQQHPHATQPQLPGILLWHAVRVSFSTSAWRTAQQSNVTALMPQSEVRANDQLYSLIDNANRSFDLIWPTIVHARLYALTDPDPTHLSPTQLQQLLTDTGSALVANFTQGAALVQLAYADPAFTPRLTHQHLNDLMHISQTESDPTLSTPIHQTESRLPTHSLEITAPPSR